MRGYLPKPSALHTVDVDLRPELARALDDKDADLKFTPDASHRRIEIGLNIISLHAIADTEHTFRGNMLLQVSWDASPMVRPTAVVPEGQTLQAWRPWIQLHNLSERDDVLNLGQPGSRWAESSEALDEEVTEFYRKPGNIGKPCPKFSMTNFIATFINELDLHSFPFDMQRLRVTIVSNQQKDAILTHKTLKDTSSATIKCNLEEDTMSAWNMELERDAGKQALGSSARAVCSYRFGGHDPFNSTEGNVYQRLDVTLVAKRDAYSVTLPIILPVFVLCMSAFSAFSIDIVEGAGERLSILYTVVLTIVAQQIVTQSRLPQLSYWTWVDVCLFALQINVYFAVVETSIVESVARGTLPDPLTFLDEETYFAALATRMREHDLIGFYVMLAIFGVVSLLMLWSGLRLHHKRALRIDGIASEARKSFEREEERLFLLYRFAPNQLVEVNLNETGPPDWRLAFVVSSPTQMPAIPPKNPPPTPLVSPTPERPKKDLKVTKRLAHVSLDRPLPRDVYQVRLFSGTDLSPEPDLVVPKATHLRNPKAHSLGARAEVRTPKPTLGNYRMQPVNWVPCVVKRIARVATRPVSYTFDVEIEQAYFERQLGIPPGSSSEYDRFLTELAFTEIRPVGGNALLPPAPLPPSSRTNAIAPATKARLESPRVDASPRGSPRLVPPTASHHTVGLVDASPEEEEAQEKEAAAVAEEDPRQNTAVVAAATPFDAEEASSPTPSSGEDFEQFDLVEARYEETDSHYYLALVVSNEGETCTVDYKGSVGVRPGVPKAWLRRPQLYVPGASVEVWEDDKWVSGEIVDHGTYEDPRFFVDLLPDRRRVQVPPKNMKIGDATSAMAAVPARAEQASGGASGPVVAYVLQ